MQEKVQTNLYILTWNFGFLVTSSNISFGPLAVKPLHASHQICYVKVDTFLQGLQSLKTGQIKLHTYYYYHYPIGTVGQRKQSRNMYIYNIYY